MPTPASAPSASSATPVSTRRCTRASHGRAATIVVTMDGDLQNPPEDIPHLVEAVESGYDVASGRRAARHDSWGRTLPSRLINGMLRRFTRRRRSPTSAARSTRTGATRSSRCSARSGRQKFTKALVLSGGATVVEVDVGHAARQDSSRYSPLRLTRLALHVLAGFWPQPIQWAGSCSASSARSPRSRSASTASSTGSATSDFPGPLLARRARPRSCSACRASSSRSSASTSAESSATWSRPSPLVPRRSRHPRSSVHAGYDPDGSGSSSPAARGSSRRTSSATCSSTRSTRSCRSTR